MAGNKAVAYMGPGEVQVQTIDYPELVLKDGPGVNPKNVGRKCEHGVILKIVSTNICGSDRRTKSAALALRLKRRLGSDGKTGDGASADAGRR